MTFQFKLRLVVIIAVILTAGIVFFPRAQPMPSAISAPQTRKLEPTDIVNRYKILVTPTKAQLFTTDIKEYNYLTTSAPSVYVAEGVAHRVFKAAVTANGQTTMPLFRLFMKTASRHYWTSDAAEYAKLRADSANVVDEGIDSYVFPVLGVTGSIPLYHLSLLNPDRHHWTADETEFNALRNSGWQAKGKIASAPGVIGYVMPK